MGGKGSPPPAPDYIGAANTQAAATKELTNIQNYANRPTINTPFGSQYWQTSSTTDPSTGQQVTSWTQNNSLAPGLQSALDAQIALQNNRSQLAGGFMGRVADEYSRPFDYANLPQMAEAAPVSSLQTGMTDYTPGLRTSFNFGSPQTSVDTEGLQRGLNTGDNPALPQFDSGFRDNVANQLMQRMQPVHDYQQRQLESRLANQGFTVGSEAYNRALSELQQRQSNERFNALDQAGNEAQRLYGMQMGSRQQAFNEDVTGGNFFNQAANQAFNQSLQAGQFGNQAQRQLYDQNLGAAQFQNQALGQAAALDASRMQSQNQAIGQQYGLNQQFADSRNRLRQQAIAEQMQRRGMSLNEMNALLSGQQVSMPAFSFGGASAAGSGQAPNYMNALQSQYDAMLGSYNAQQAQSASNTQAAISAAAMLAYAFSDERLKSNIRRVGGHPIGVGIYDYTMMGMPQRGVIAQEVQRVRPDLVKKHANGYLMVNYGGL